MGDAEVNVYGTIRYDMRTCRFVCFLFGNQSINQSINQSMNHEGCLFLVFDIRICFFSPFHFFGLSDFSAVKKDMRMPYF